MCDKSTNTENNKTCLICWDYITADKWVMCVRCKILLHNECFEKDRQIHNRNHCLCPHCQRVGSLGALNASLELAMRGKDAINIDL